MKAVWFKLDFNIFILFLNLAQLHDLTCIQLAMLIFRDGECRFEYAKASSHVNIDVPILLTMHMLHALR